MLDKTFDFQNDKLEFIKNPVVAEFLGLAPNSDYAETDLETSIISNIQKFLMEMGKGYAFVARQQHIKTEKEDYFIDLVFYNEDIARYSVLHGNEQLFASNYKLYLPTEEELRKEIECKNYVLFTTK